MAAVGSPVLTEFIEGGDECLGDIASAELAESSVAVWFVVQRVHVQSG